MYHNKIIWIIKVIRVIKIINIIKIIRILSWALLGASVGGPGSSWSGDLLRAVFVLRSSWEPLGGILG